MAAHFSTCVDNKLWTTPRFHAFDRKFSPISSVVPEKQVFFHQEGIQRFELCAFSAGDARRICLDTGFGRLVPGTLLVVHLFHYKKLVVVVDAAFFCG